MKKVTIFLFLLANSIASFSQVDSTTYNQIFDDKDIAKSTTVWKTDVISLIHGSWGVILEKQTNKVLSYEIGGMVLMPYYVHDFLTYFIADSRAHDLKNNSIGLGGSIAGKLYTKHALELQYYGASLSLRKWKTFRFVDFTFTNGKQKLLGDRIMLEYGFGIGMRFIKSIDDTGYEEIDLSPIVPLYIRFGLLK